MFFTSSLSWVGRSGEVVKQPNFPWSSCCRWGLGWNWSLDSEYFTTSSPSFCDIEFSEGTNKPALPSLHCTSPPTCWATPLCPRPLSAASCSCSPSQPLYTLGQNKLTAMNIDYEALYVVLTWPATARSSSFPSRASSTAALLQAGPPHILRSSRVDTIRISGQQYSFLKTAF